MKSFKIYGTKYPLNSTTSAPAEAFGFKNELLDDPPEKGKVCGYVKMEDGSIIECYKKTNPLVVILIIILILSLIGGAVAYFLVFQPKDVEFLGDIIKQGDDNNVVTYSGFPSVRGSMLNIQFTNGDYPATITVTGNGIETQQTSVEAGAFIDLIPITVNTTEGLVEAFITIQTETSTQTFPIVVELPENLNANDINEGLEGYWFGENIYGAP